MKITLIPERCIACGLCQTYSDLFDYHDNGIVRFTMTLTNWKRNSPSQDVLEAVKNSQLAPLIGNQEA